MAALSKHAILCIAAYALVRRRRRRRRNTQPQRVGRVWIKPHIGRHDEQGAYENLVEELRHDPAEFEKFHRVNPATFDFLLAKVDGVISSVYRASISAVSGSAMRHGNISLWLVCGRTVDATDVFDPHTPCNSCWTDSEIFHCDWSVAGRLMRQMSLTRTHHATVVGPIRFSNRSNNCRVCKINGRQLSLVRTHHATIVFSSSLRPTDDKNRMVCAGLKPCSHRGVYPT